MIIISHCNLPSKLIQYNKIKLFHMIFFKNKKINKKHFNWGIEIIILIKKNEMISKSHEKTFFI